MKLWFLSFDMEEAEKLPECLYITRLKSQLCERHLISFAIINTFLVRTSASDEDYVMMV